MKEKLYILWTNADPVTSELMVFMYSENAILHKWWDEITIIVWGATSKLISENKNIQKRLKEIADIGVNISACKSCADKLEVADKISELDIELKYWGEPLTKIIKENQKLITI